MAAKFGLSAFIVVVAIQVLPSSGSCLPSCSNPSYGSYGPGSYSSGNSANAANAAAAAAAGAAAAAAAAPMYAPNGPSYYSGSWYGPAPADGCNAPPLYLPPPVFPQLPTVHAPKPLTIPLQVPSVIPVGKVCVCKAIQIQPSLIPVQRPCGCRPLPPPTC